MWQNDLKLRERVGKREREKESGEGEREREREREGETKRLPVLTPVIYQNTFIST